MKNNSEDQPTVEIDPKQVVHAYLEQARENWMDARDSAERAGHMSAALNGLEAETMGTLDRLLEELHALGAVAVQATGGQVSHG